MYIIIRIIVVIAIALTLVLTLRKKRLMLWLKIVIPVMAALSVFFAVQYAPVENLFYSFDNAESAYTYYTGEQSIKTLHGQESAAVIGNLGIFRLFKKDGNGYKIPGSYPYDKIYFIADTFFVNIIYYPNGTDGYIYFVLPSSEAVNVKDSDESVFQKVEVGRNMSCYYAVIQKPENDYWLKINGRMYEIKKYEVTKCNI